MSGGNALTRPVLDVGAAKLKTKSKPKTNSKTKTKPKTNSKTKNYSHRRPNSPTCCSACTQEKCWLEVLASPRKTASLTEVITVKNTLTLYSSVRSRLFWLWRKASHLGEKQVHNDMATAPHKKCTSATGLTSLKSSNSWRAC